MSTHYRVPTFTATRWEATMTFLFDGASMVVDRGGRLILQGKEFETDLLVWDSENNTKNSKGLGPKRKSRS